MRLTLSSAIKRAPTGQGNRQHPSIREGGHGVPADEAESANINGVNGAAPEPMRLRVAHLMARMMAPSILHMQILQGMSGAAVIYALFWLHASPAWWLVSLAAYFVTACLGLSVTLHRGLTHRAFRMPRPMEIGGALLAVLGGTGSSIGWVAMHRAHHALGDGAKDPHALDKHGWWIVASAYDYHFDPRYARDLLRDPAHLFLHRYYAPILILWALLLAAIDVKLLIFVFFVPAFAQITISNLANLLGHGFGYRNYETKDKSTNNVLIAVLAWGEGWHNNHHAAPSEWNFRRKWWEFDPGALCVAALRRLGALRDYEPIVTSADETRTIVAAPR
jgi:fatty-acid desaturase